MGMCSGIVRWSGLAGLGAGGGFLLWGILVLVGPPQRGPSSVSDYLLEIVVVAAFVLTLVTLAGLHAAQRHSGRYGIRGAAGFWLTFLGYVVVLVTVHLTLLAGGEPILSV